MLFDEDYCTDVFREVVPELESFCTIKLIHLLEDNVEELFATDIKLVRNAEELHATLFHWAKFCSQYLSKKQTYSTVNYFYDTSPKIRATKSKSYQEEHFKKDIENLFLAMSGDGIKLKPKSEKLKTAMAELFEDAYNNPSEYISEKLHIPKASTEKVDGYLRALGLKGKSTKIDEFCISLANL